MLVIQMLLLLIAPKGIEIKQIEIPKTEVEELLIAPKGIEIKFKRLGKIGYCPINRTKRN